MKDFVYSENVAMISGILYKIGGKNVALRLTRTGKWHPSSMSNMALRAIITSIAPSLGIDEQAKNALFAKCFSEGKASKEAGDDCINPYGQNIDDVFKRCAWSAGYHGY